ncbi:MAG: glycine cleavage system protein GcvH [Promethearchaeota archaeon]
MSYKTPDNLKYHKEHEWVLQLDDGNVKIGITDYAQAKLKDIVYVELPEVGDTIEVNSEFGAVESVKGISDLFAPVSGEVVEVNEELEDSPESINEDAYAAWMIVLKPSNLEEDLQQLLDASGYSDYIATLE